MNKIDVKLDQVRTQLVPSFLSETEFWNFYFYKIEVIKASVGLPTNLGAKIDWEARN